MEHRWGHRVPVDISVRISFRPDIVGPGRMLDISASGAFVRSSIDPPILARVQVEMGVRRRGCIGIERVGAQIVRKDGNGLGLEWQEFGPPAIRELLGLAIDSGPGMEPQLRLFRGRSAAQDVPSPSRVAATENAFSSLVPVIDLVCATAHPAEPRLVGILTFRHQSFGVWTGVPEPQRAGANSR